MLKNRTFLKNALVAAAMLAFNGFAVASASANVAYDCKPGISAEECARRKAQSERDKAAYRERQSQRSSSSYNRSSSSSYGSGSSSYGSSSRSSSSYGSGSSYNSNQQSQSYGGYKCPPGVSAADCADRAAQSARDKARNAAQNAAKRENQQQQYGNGSSNYNNAQSQEPQYKYGSKEEREAAKAERKRIRDAGGTTTTTEVVRKKDGSTTVVTNTSDRYGTTTQVRKEDEYGRVKQKKTVEQEKTGYKGEMDIRKKTVDYRSNGTVRKIVKERSDSFRNSSQYDTVRERETIYKGYQSTYRTKYYTSPRYREYNFYGGFYYDFRPVILIDDYYYVNPLIYWLFNADYSREYYSVYYGYDYTDFIAFSGAGAFYPTQDLVDLSTAVFASPYSYNSGFRQSMSQLYTKLNSRVYGTIGRGDIVITHQERYGDNLAVVEGYVNSSREVVGFKALLDFENPYATLVFVPRAWDGDPTDADLEILIAIDHRLGGLNRRSAEIVAPAPVIIPDTHPSSGW